MSALRQLAEAGLSPQVAQPLAGTLVAPTCADGVFGLSSPIIHQGDHSISYEQ